MQINVSYFRDCSVVKESTCQCRRFKRLHFYPWVGKIPWRRKWQPTPVFLPGESHGQRSMMGYSPWGHKESDTTEQLTLSYLLTDSFNKQGRRIVLTCILDLPPCLMNFLMIYLLITFWRILLGFLYGLVFHPK